MEKGGDREEVNTMSLEESGESHSEMQRRFPFTWRMVVLWGAIGLLIFIGFYLGLDKKFLALVILVFGFLTQAFTGLLGLLGILPWVGPVLVKVISGPFIWLLNGLGTLVAFFALRRGYKVDLLKSRIIVTTFLLGLVVGILLGTLL
jgi:hypothetical protein